jgi:polyisoprenyl-teichoic acid--peptidoglycan teichoic acid transferase
MTARLPATASVLPYPAPRSSWVVRVVFAVISLAIVAELAIVASLIYFTFLRVSDKQAPTAGYRDQGVLQVIPQVLGASKDSVNVWDHHGPINILLMGLDTNECANSPGTTALRTDTIIVVRVDPELKRVAMLTIPRDLYVSIPGVGGRKINTAHVSGELDKALPGGGPELLKETIAENLGIPIHRWARVDFKGFLRIVDAVNGVDIDVPPSPGNPKVGLYDPFYPDNKCGYLTVDVKPGLQHMDGVHALQYARSRETTTDFDRSRRQMQVLLAIRAKALSLGVLRNLPQLVPALMDTVNTDFTPTELLSLARIARDVKTEDIVTMQIDRNVVYDEMLMIGSTAQAVLRLQPDRYAAIKERFLAIEAPTPTPDASATAAAAATAPPAGAVRRRQP